MKWKPTGRRAGGRLAGAISAPRSGCLCLVELSQMVNEIFGGSRGWPDLDGPCQASAPEPCAWSLQLLAGYRVPCFYAAAGCPLCSVHAGPSLSDFLQLCGAWPGFPCHGILLRHWWGLPSCHSSGILSRSGIKSMSLLVPPAFGRVVLYH